MTSLSRDKIERFWRDGVLTVEDAVSPKLLSAMREQFAAWVEAPSQ